VAALIPAFQAGGTVAGVVRGLAASAAQRNVSLPIWVVDDGSTDSTAWAAEQSGARVLRHQKNLGKGAALLTGFRALFGEGFDVAVTVDADGQHPADQAVMLACAPATADTLILGVRNLLRDGAPPSHRFSNAISNRFLSWFSGHRLIDTQCGLRRYPLRQTLALTIKSPGYALEAEIILRALGAGWQLEQVPVNVVYAGGAARASHFHVVRDPAKIVFRVLGTWLDVSIARRAGK
jgi:glycosyltransferase involved in cell wall biosynthesis